MAKLIHEDADWFYLGFNGPATRQLRVWQVEPDRVVAVVTERPDDQGTSITNAAEMVYAQLAAEYPDDQVEVVEHWTASELSDEHFDGVAIVGDQPTWWSISTDEMVERLGPDLLDDADERALARQAEQDAADYADERQIAEHYQEIENRATDITDDDGDEDCL